MSKILILANSSSGLYDFRGEVLQKLIDNSYDIVVSVPDYTKVPEIEKLGCRVINTCINRRGVNPKEDYKLFKAYIKLLRDEHPDLVMTYTIKPNIYGGYACSKLGIPYISTITGLGSAFQWNGFKKKFIVLMYKAGLKKCRCVFFQNRENMQIFEELGIKGCDSRLVNGSGVNLQKHKFESYEGHEGDTTSFLYIGRFMKEKGSDELLSAAKMLKDKYADKVAVSAMGYPDEDYEDKMSKAQKEGYLEVIPFQKDVHPFIKEADAIVMPSYHEGMSNVILEASSTGRPVLASDISGCKEGVDNNVTGYLFSPRDSIALFESMDKFMKLKKEDRVKMGLAARAKMEREFDREKVAESYLSKIKSIIITSNDLAISHPKSPK